MMTFIPSPQHLVRDSILGLAGISALAVPAAAQRVNFAKYQQVTASVANSTYAADFAADGIASNFHSWRTGNTSAPKWLEIHFPRPVAVASAHLYSGLFNSATPSQVYQNFKFQYLDGTDWIDIPGAAVTGNTLAEVNVVFPASATSSRFRFHSTDDGNRTLRELALFPPNLVGGVEQGFPIGTDVRLNLACQRPTVASSTRDNEHAKRAVDGYVDDASRWRCDDSAPDETLEIDLVDTETVGSAHLFSGGVDAGADPAPDFVLDWWDGGAWQPVPGAAFTGNTNPELVIPFPSPVTTAKIRFRTTSAHAARVRELLLFPPREGGYPLGQDVITGPPPTTTWETHADANFILRCDISEDRRLAAINGSVVFANGGAGGRTAQAWQLLRNQRDGSYRVRHHATGLCLALKDISSANNNLVVLEPYSGLPHQNWWLEPADATHYRILNAYSGLALQSLNSQWTGGNPMSVRTPGSGGLQRWRKTTPLHHPKKGIAATNNIPNPPFTDPTATRISHFFQLYRNSSWSYTWGRQRSTAFPFMEADHTFHPMQWGNSNFHHGSSQGPLDVIRNDLQSNPRPVFLMGFNEPDGEEQANMTVATAIARWPRLEAMDMPLVSPAPVNAPNEWLTDFYQQADARGFRVDATGVHWYKAPNASALITYLENVHNTYGRPIWLTEFSVVRWQGSATWTLADNFNFIAEFLWRAEDLPWLRRYSLFNFPASAEGAEPNPFDPPEAPRSNSYRPDGSLTAFGQLYAGWDAVTSTAAHKAYHLHNRGRYLRVRNPASVSPVDWIESVSPESDIAGVQWFLVPGTTENTVRICSTRNGRRLRFYTGTYVGLAASTDDALQTEWRIVPEQHGWCYIEHPNTNQRLRIDAAGTLVMGSITSTGDDSKWRFVVPAAPEPVAPPNPPTGLVTAATASQITISWQPSAGAASYAVERAGDPSGPWTNIADERTVPEWTDDGLASATTYYYRVAAANQHGTSDPSAPVSASTLAHPLATYEGWAQQFLGELPPDQRTLEADPDQDGMENLLEFAFLTNPTIPEPSQFKVVAATPDAITLEFPWNWRAGENSWQILHGQDLANIAAWSTIEPGFTTSTRDGDRDLIHIVVPTDHPNRGFYVLKATIGS